jgi:hypothetical protein
MPTIYGKQIRMNTSEVGTALGMLVLPEMKGLCRARQYCTVTAGLRLFYIPKNGIDGAFIILLQNKT